MSNKDLHISHRNQVNVTSDVRLVTELINFNVSHVVYLRIFKNLNKLNMLLLLTLQNLQGCETE